MPYQLNFTAIRENISLFGDSGNITIPDTDVFRPSEMTIDESCENYFLQIMFILREYYYCEGWKSFTKQQLDQLIEHDIEEIYKPEDFSDEFINVFPTYIDQFLKTFCSECD